MTAKAMNDSEWKEVVERPVRLELRLDQEAQARAARDEKILSTLDRVNQHIMNLEIQSKHWAQQSLEVVRRVKALEDTQEMLLHNLRTLAQREHQTLETALDAKRATSEHHTEVAQTTASLFEQIGDLKQKLDEGAARKRSFDEIQAKKADDREKRMVQRIVLLTTFLAGIVVPIIVKTLDLWIRK